MKKRGRQTILDAELQKRICALLVEGCDQKTACSICGISERAFHSWKERGQKGEEPYATFFDATSRARNRHKLRLVKLVIDGAEGKLPRHADWKAASWLLEKGWPLEFGKERRAPTETLLPELEPLEPMTPEEEKRILELFRCDGAPKAS
jgi:hypothetical protein